MVLELGFAVLLHPPLGLDGKVVLDETYVRVSAAMAGDIMSKYLQETGSQPTEEELLEQLK